jgi:hypothetical protein
MPNYRLKLDVTKLDKDAFFKGKKGTYVDLVIWENDQPDEYGNTHSVKQDMGKDRRGEKTPYVGNMTPFGDKRGGQQSAAPAHSPSQPQRGQDFDNDDSDSIPF